MNDRLVGDFHGKDILLANFEKDLTKDYYVGCEKLLPLAKV